MTYRFAQSHFPQARQNSASISRASARAVATSKPIPVRSASTVTLAGSGAIRRSRTAPTPRLDLPHHLGPRASLAHSSCVRIRTSDAVGFGTAINSANGASNCPIFPCSSPPGLVNLCPIANTFVGNGIAGFATFTSKSTEISVLAPLAPLHVVSNPDTFFEIQGFAARTGAGLEGGENPVHSPALLVFSPPPSLLSHEVS
jgi:hypothetical protein